MKTWALVVDTWREAFARYTLLGFIAVSSLFLLVLTFALNLDIVDGALAAGTLFGFLPLQTRCRPVASCCGALTRHPGHASIASAQPGPSTRSAKLKSSGSALLALCPAR